MSESVEISRGSPTHTTLTDNNCQVFVKFLEQFNKSEIFNDEFYFQIF